MVERGIVDVLKIYISLIRSEDIQVDKAFLYGSYLTDSATDESDIDLMIVTDAAIDDNLAGKIWSLTRKINSKIEPYLIGSDRFNSDDHSPLIEIVKRTGLQIY